MKNKLLILTLCFLIVSIFLCLFTWKKKRKALALLEQNKTRWQLLEQYYREDTPYSPAISKTNQDPRPFLSKKASAEYAKLSPKNRTFLEPILSELITIPNEQLQITDIKSSSNYIQLTFASHSAVFRRFFRKMQTSEIPTLLEKASTELRHSPSKKSPLPPSISSFTLSFYTPLNNG